MCCAYCCRHLVTMFGDYRHNNSPTTIITPPRSRDRRKNSSAAMFTTRHNHSHGLIFIDKTIQPWISLLPIWMTACLLLFHRTISTFFIVFCLNAILIRTVLGLGTMNLYWQPSVTRETFLKDNCLKICIDILFSCVLSTVFQRLKVKWSEVRPHRT